MVMGQRSQLTPLSEWSTIRVDEVDFANRFVIGIDKTYATIQAIFRSVPASFRIPMQGELWSIERKGYTWYLGERLDNDDDHSALTEMSPGDTRVHADGELRMIASSHSINGQPFGAAALDHFVGNGAQTVFELSSDPVSDYTVSAYVSTAFLHQGISYSVSGRNVTFTTPPAGSAPISIYYQRWGYAYTDGRVVQGRAEVSAVEEFIEA